MTASATAPGARATATLGCDTGIEGAFQAGVTHTEHSVGTGQVNGAPPLDLAAATRARDRLASVGPFQNTHVVGWGGWDWGNPKPPPGPDGKPDWDKADWTRLDSRLADNGLICQTGGTRVVTLCCAPQWMTGPGSIWPARPARAYFDDFADMALAVAKRYPKVRYFQVWNEFKDMWKDNATGWDVGLYTDLYEKVFTKLKAFNPNLRVGGPYAPVDTWCAAGSSGSTAHCPSPPDPSLISAEVSGDGWAVDKRVLDNIRTFKNLTAQRGIVPDFIDVDGGTSTKDNYFPTGGAATSYFAKVTAWLKTEFPGRPIWWSEFYAPVKAGSNDSTPAMIDGSLAALRDAGASVGLLWSPETNWPGEDPAGSFPGVWTYPTGPNGGSDTAYTEIMRRYAGAR